MGLFVHEEEAVKPLKSTVIGMALLTTAAPGCGGDGDSGPLGNVDALLILQRAKRNDTGDVFQYASYVPGARLIKLSPPTADGTKTVLCCDNAGPDFAGMDIQSYDLSFDAQQIVFAGRSAKDSNYGLFLLTLADGSVTQIATDPGRDYVSPIFLPGDKIMFTTNSVVSNPVTDAMPPQHRDEYERGVTTQMGVINVDGTNEQLGPRNLSHRVQPSLASDGRIILTQWDHLGEENSGHLMFMQQDMTSLREAFGKEGTGAANSTLKAREISPGRFVAVATSRDRTLQSGALIDIRLGFTSKSDSGLRADDQMSERNASYVMLTPDVPTDRAPSANTIGRYYDAFPLNAKDRPDLLVSWADGPVESSVLSAAGLQPNFGIYVYDSERLQRRPILDDPDMWDIFARPLQTRSAPAVTASQSDGSLGQTALIGSLDVRQSTLAPKLPAGATLYGVRVMEGFSSEEGFPEMFGTTMHEGHTNLGVAPRYEDGSWLAKVPANVPLHLQTVDQFGMALFNEPVWFSARAGESRVCGGCHEDRARSTVIQPGDTMASRIGPLDAMSMVPRANRQTAAADLYRNNVIAADGSGIEKLIDAAWGSANPMAGGTGSIQKIFDDNCVTACHDAANSAGVPGYTISDAMGNVILTWTLDLSSRPVTLNYGPQASVAMQTYSASYFSMAGPDMEAIERNGLVITGTFKRYMNPLDARGSELIKKLNPTQLFPTPNASVRAFAGSSHLQQLGRPELTPTEFYKLILAADMGVNYFARPNNPHASTY